MARDSDGFLYVFRDKPEKGGWIWDTSASDSASPFLFNDMFSAIKWEDEEPVLINDIYNSQILNNAERKYLKAVLKPFHDEVEFVVKCGHNFNDDGTYSNEYLYIEFHDGNMTFPDFYAGEMYKGMELDLSYKLDELGITYEE